MDKFMLDLYTDYLISSSHYRTATGLSDCLNGAISHDRVSRFLSEGRYGSKDLWLSVKLFVRQVERDDGVLIFDDTIEEKPHTDENDIVCWHYDHANDRNVKGMNILTALAHYEDGEAPVSFETVKKDIFYCDVKTKKHKRSATRSKNTMFRDMIDAAQRNKVKYAYVLADSWYSSTQNMKHIIDKGRKFIFALKSNRTVSLAAPNKGAGVFLKVSDIELEEGCVQKCWIKGLKTPIFLTKQVFANKDQSTGTLYLATNDLSLDASRIGIIYQKRWTIEVYHKSLKTNIGLAKSPTKTAQTQANHIFASLCAFVKLEALKIKTKLNHFAMKYQLVISATSMAMNRLKCM